MTTPKQPIFLRILKDGKTLDVKQFTGQQIVIGREGNVDALIADGSVSPIHAMIEERGEGQYFLCDLGGQTGTFVNGEKIVDHSLESGQEFKIGDVVIEFHIGIPRSKKAPGEVTSVTSISPVAKMPSAPPPSAEPPKAIVPVETKTHTITKSHGDSKTVTETKTDSKTDSKHDSKSEGTKSGSFKQPKEEHTVTSSFEKSRGSIPKDVPKETRKGGAAPLVGPASVSVGAFGGSTGSQKHKAPKGTFAPPSTVKLQESLKPGKGTVVEVAIVWKDRILNTFHFDKHGVVKIGSHPQNQIILPHFGSVRVSHPLIRIDGAGAAVYLTQDMTGEVVKDSTTTSIDEMRRKGSMLPAGTGYSYNMQQNEVMKINFGEGVSLIVRFVTNGPDSRLLPWLDMTVNQLTALVVGLMGTALFLFYAYLYAPALPDQQEEQEPPRKAQFFYKKHEVPVVVEEQPVAHNAPENVKSKAPPAPAQGQEGPSKEPKHTKNATSQVAKAKGKSKSHAVPAAPAKAVVKNRDMSHVGLVGAFATNGNQADLNKAYKASGAMAGLSQSASGTAAGTGDTDGGQSLRDVGANGNGTATVGIVGVNTKGRGGGVTGYGTGNIGSKKYATLIAGDDQATFTGSIDKEAIRRVVQANLRQIKSCYERGLNQEPGLYGKIVIKWTIGPGGHVLEAAVGSSTMNSAEVENCAVAHLKTWKFPEPPAGEVAVVSYPFVFQAQE